VRSGRGGLRLESASTGRFFGKPGTFHSSAPSPFAQPRQQPFVLFCWGFAGAGWQEGPASSRSAEIQEGAVSVRLFIGNLPYAASEAELREHLSSVGEPTQIVLPVDRETGRPRGFAVVDYADRAVAEAAISRFDQQPFKGRPLAVSEARPREERGPGGPRPGGFSGPRPVTPGGGGFTPRPSGWAPRPDSGGAPGGARN